MTLVLARSREMLRTSLWFLPSVCVLLAVIASAVALRIDGALGQRDSGWFLFAGGPDSARAVVGTIATSMLTFTGLVFSITMLVLQLASNQLSPRVMRTFLRDRSNQLVLGVFIATFLYALLVLRRITDESVPALSVWLAVVLVLACVALFVYYIHHIAQSIRPVSVMEHVAAETRGALDRLYPAAVGEGLDQSWHQRQQSPTTVVHADRGGVLIRVNEEALGKSLEAGSCVELRATIGDYVREGAPLFTVHGRCVPNPDEVLLDAVDFGPERTMYQDAAFGFRQLVDIGVRALSPGINDPTTAVQALDRLHGLLGRVLALELPSPNRDIGDGKVAILPRPDWADYVSLACDEIRRAGEAHIQVQRRLRAMLEDLLSAARPAQREPLLAQLELLNGQLSDAFNGAEVRRAATPSAQGQGAGSGGA